MADESTDTAVSEQLILYMRYADISREAVGTRFACVQKVEGHPNAVNLLNPLGAGCIYICTKVPYPSPRDAYIYAHLTYFTFTCLPTYFAYCRGFCCSPQLLRASHFTNYSIEASFTPAVQCASSPSRHSSSARGTAFKEPSSRSSRCRMALWEGSRRAPLSMVGEECGELCD